MSNSQKLIDFGSADIVRKPFAHPEVKRRFEEVKQIAIELSNDEILEALFDYSSRKWHRLNTATIDFKPESKGEENK